MLKHLSKHYKVSTIIKTTLIFLAVVIFIGYVYSNMEALYQLEAERNAMIDKAINVIGCKEEDLEAVMQYLFLD